MRTTCSLRYPRWADRPLPSVRNPGWYDPHLLRGCAAPSAAGPALPCPALCCPVLPCPALPCPALPCPLHALSAPVALVPTGCPGCVWWHHMQQTPTGSVRRTCDRNRNRPSTAKSSSIQHQPIGPTAFTARRAAAAAVGRRRDVRLLTGGCGWRAAGGSAGRTRRSTSACDAAARRRRGCTTATRSRENHPSASLPRRRRQWLGAHAAGGPRRRFRIARPSAPTGAACGKAAATARTLASWRGTRSGS